MEIIIILLLFIFSVIIYKNIKANNITQDPVFISLQRNSKSFLNEIEKQKAEYFTKSKKLELLDKYKESYEELKENKSYLNAKDPSLNEFFETYNNLNELVESWNDEYVRSELEKHENYFDNIDGKSFDEQQRLATVVDEDNNLVVAGAGTGKTLLISGKIKYLVEKKEIDPDNILLITFTRKAAQEMENRVNNNLNLNLKAQTFHGLGMSIITKHKAYSPHVNEDSMPFINRYFKDKVLNDENKVTKIINFFGYYFNIPVDRENIENLGELSDHYKSMDLETLKSIVIREKERLKDEKTTIKGEIVKSLEELHIANFLFLNGIKYEYERMYPYPVNDRYRKHYRPDFYLPEYDIYIEHFGVTKDFKTPWLSDIESEKYLEGIKWKRDLHMNNNTNLIETYSYYNNEGILLSELKKKLLNYNVKFKKVDYKKIYESIFQGDDGGYFTEFKKLVKTFLELFKSRGYTSKDFKSLNLEAEKIERKFLRQRTKMFLAIMEPLYDAYQKELNDNMQIDFNDMINLATDLIEEEGVTQKYDYIIIDEYQDTSISRFNLVKTIKEQTGAKTLSVGDDWQSIFRFAGSDVNLFTNYEKFMGYCERLKIENTYRNSQELIDIAGKFIMKNEKQIKKDLSSKKHHSNPLRILTYSNFGTNSSKNDFKREFLKAFSKSIEEIVYLNGEESEVTILGRNNFDIEMFREEVLPPEKRSGKFIEIDNEMIQISKQENEYVLKLKKYPKLKLSFLTVHRSKGLEADNIIVINLESKLHGFPNKKTDDPVLSLVLTDLDEFAHAEERRLFYVALTRTKNVCYLIAPDHHQSIFVQELIRDQEIKYEYISNVQSVHDKAQCPMCKKGKLVIRENNEKDSKFLGCSNYPICDNTFKELEILNEQIICTSCEGYMVRRTSKYGEFYGCTNYPYCKNTIQVETAKNQNISSKQHDKKQSSQMANKSFQLSKNSGKDYKAYKYKVWSKFGYGRLRDFIDFRLEAEAKQLDFKVVNNKIEWIMYETDNLIDTELFEKYDLEYERLY